MSKILLWPVLAGGAATLILVWWRGFFWQHAVIVGLGVTALVYTAIRTISNLKDLHKRGRP